MQIDAAPNAESALPKIGPYHLLSVLGEGGFGVVYLAERRDPFVQAVALKVLRAGMDSPSLIARFELERQALALMDHPNVARVLDGGVTEPGSRLGENRPYFAMELVAGKPITEFCRDEGLSIRERLELFIPVCEAVQHAHTKGVVHRDLKPSNILVSRARESETGPHRTPSQSAPVPKVIDFGVAKALSGSSLHQATMTGHGNFIGTPDYMSPEQAAGASGDIDTRTDVYSLGVVLYELLTGVTPFERDRLMKGSLLETMQLIRETEPPRPSIRALGTPRSGSNAPERDGAGLARRLKGDLDWIVMRAMEKSRERRYQSPSELAADIGRYLRTESVEAGPPSRLYRASKFVRRNKVLVGAAAIALAALVAGLGAALYGMNEAVKSERAEREQRLRAEAANRFVSDAIENARPRGQSTQITVLDLVEYMASRLGTGAAAGPAVQADDRVAFRLQIADIYTGLGLREQAEEQLAAALAEVTDERRAGLDPLRARVHLASLRVSDGRAAEARQLLDEAIPRLRDSEREGARDLLAWALMTRGRLLRQASTAGEAEVALREAIGLCGKPEEGHAQRLCDASMMLAQILGEVPERREEAIRTAEYAIEVSEQWVPRNRLFRLYALNTLGSVRRRAGDTEGAIRSFERALELAEQPGVVPELTLSGVQITLAEALRDAGRLDEASELAEAAVATRRRLVPQSTRVSEALDVIAGIAGDRNDLAKAEATYREQLAIARSPEISNEPLAALAMTGLADVLERRGEMEEARSLAAEALEIRGRTLPEGHWKLHSTRSILGAALAGLGRCDEAEPILTDAAAAVSADAAAPPGVLRRVLERTIAMHERCGTPDKAEKWRAELAQKAH